MTNLGHLCDIVRREHRELHLRGDRVRSEFLPAFRLEQRNTEHGLQHLILPHRYVSWDAQRLGLRHDAERQLGFTHKMWLLHQPVITAPIVGANSVDQLQESLKATAITLSDQDTEELDDVSAWQ